MNTPLRRLTSVVVLMFVVLMGGASWVQFVQAPDLNSDSRNVRTLYREYNRDREGSLLDFIEAFTNRFPGCVDEYETLLTEKSHLAHAHGRDRGDLGGTGHRIRPHRSVPAGQRGGRGPAAGQSVPGV